MAGPNLQINIGANVAGAIAGLNQTGAAANTAATGLNNAGAAATNAGKGLNALAPAIRPNLQGLTLMGQAANNAGRGLSALPPAVNAAGQGLGQLRPNTQSATIALTNLGRVAQDAPFGLIGIANNIEPLISSFVSVGRNAGSASAAFKAIGASLIGPGGLILAVGVISTALTLMGQGFFSSKKSVDEFNDALRKANEEAAQEVAKLTVLNAIASDTTRSMDERTQATKRLQKEFPQYFGNLSKEAILNGQVADATAKARDAIVSKAKATAILSLITKESEKQLQIELRRQNLQREFETRATELAKRQADLNKNLGVTPRAARLTDEAFSDIVKRLNEANKEFTESDQKINDLIKLFTTEDLKSPFDDITDKTGKDVDALQKRIDALTKLKDTIGLTTAQQREFIQLQIELLQRDGVKLNFTPQEVKDQIDELLRTRFGREVQPSPITIPIIVQPKPVIDVAGAVLPGGFISDDAFDKVIEAAKARSRDLNGRLNESIKNEIDISNTISNAISDTITIGLEAAIDGGADVGDIFGGVLNVISSAFKQLGQALIAYGVALEAVKLAITNPAIAVAAGVGLIAASALLQKALPKFATGITSFIGGVALVGENGPELVRLPAGSDVIPNSRMGEFNSGIILVPSIKFSGADFRIMLNQVDRRRGQLG